MGLRVNEHLAFLGRELARHGVSVQRNEVIRDDVEEIRAAFLRSWENSDIVITTGGPGQTVDDLTKEVIAEALGMKLELVDSVKVALEERFARLGRTLSSNNLRQCYVPEGAEVLINKHGTAPGLLMCMEEKLLLMLPGYAVSWSRCSPPRPCPVLQEEDFLREEEQYIQLRTFGIPESFLEQKLRRFLKGYSGLKIAYCARGWCGFAPFARWGGRLFHWWPPWFG